MEQTRTAKQHSLAQPSPSSARMDRGKSSEAAFSPREDKGSVVPPARPSSPAFLVSPEYGLNLHDDDSDPDRTLKARGSYAPRSSHRTSSPSPLVWSDSGWHAGSFSFAPVPDSSDTPTPSGIGPSHAVVEDRKSSYGSDSLVSLAETAASGTSSKGRTKAITPSDTSPTAPRFKLAPTAPAFAPKPKIAPLTPATSVAPKTRLPALDINSTLQRFAFPSAVAVGASNSPASSPLEPCTPPSGRRPSEVGSVDLTSQFDHDGRLVSSGARYNIADEILQLQSAPLGPVHPDELETLETLDAPEGFDTAPNPRLRALSEDSAAFTRGIEQWRQQQPFPPRQQPLSPLSPSASFGSGAAFERSRSSSLASTTSNSFGARPAFERSNTVAQLQSYFGPSAGEVSVQLPGGFESYTPSYPPGSAPLSRQPSYTSLGGVGGAAAYPVHAHPEPFNLTPDDPLYLEARQVFVDSSCASLGSAPSAAHQQSLAAHFDRAMHQLHPLAMLYGLSQDAAKQLLAEPATSGVSEVVLRVAAMMGRQQQMASVQRSAMGTILPGPSPNNRKLALYKTELCRSWEERHSCRYGVKCQFAHGVHELRNIARHPKFKSEICRTFWQQGSCPYGQRCCFIHAVPDSTSSPEASPRKDSAPVSRSGSPPPRARMTSTAVTGAPSRTFGPALAELLGSSSQNSPVKSEGGAASASSSSSLETSTLFGLGMRERPGQAPPAYKEAPQSRLQRLSLSAGPSSTSLSSLSSLNSGSVTAPLPASAYNPAGGAPHSRHDSTHSFMTTSSVSSAAAYSPLLTRTGSSSSLSSAGSPVLQRVGGDWLSHSAASMTSKNASLEWPAIEELALDDPPASASSALYSRHTFA
ncbi:hypothetical protein Rhopal_000975-T1 [Rhodotorula paludigena]|uniref:C3H1-type domain-containing protein n=1 Tax=Rhodotorula paludigena TaxID=86838 RepID=A0AAV5GDQ5_9BASI|nr:hypothetical protein Rhopal_000975-T1 [Rhodotorula paludigena]